MTPSECKKDAKARLDNAGIEFAKLSAKTWSFEGFGYGQCVCVTIHGAKTPFGPHRATPFQDVPKPSQGGYTHRWDDAICS